MSAVRTYRITSVMQRLRRFVGDRLVNKVLDKISAKNIGNDVIVDESGLKQLENILNKLLGPNTTKELLLEAELIAEAPPPTVKIQPPPKEEKEKAITPGAPQAKTINLQEKSKLLGDSVTLYEILRNAEIKHIKTLDASTTPILTYISRHIPSENKAFLIRITGPNNEIIRLLMDQGKIIAAWAQINNEEVYGEDCIKLINELKGCYSIVIYRIRANLKDIL